MKRFHVHAHVENLEASIAFYSRMFAAAPARVESDYAKWMLDDPRINFAISTRGSRLGVDHLGIQTDTEEELVALREQALAVYVGTIATAFRETADALVNLEQVSRAEADVEARLKAARAALAVSDERYRAGYSPYLEVLDAQRTANDAAIAFVRQRQARLAFSVDLMKALGGGWAAAD